MGSNFLDDALPVPNTQRLRKRKGKPLGHNSQKRTKQANYIAIKTLHQSPDTQVIEQDVKRLVDCDGQVQSNLLYSRTSDSPPGSDPDLTTLAQALHEPSNVSAVPHGNIAPGHNSWENSFHNPNSLSSISIVVYGVA